MNSLFEKYLSHLTQIISLQRKRFRVFKQYNLKVVYLYTDNDDSNFFKNAQQSKCLFVSCAYYCNTKNVCYLSYFFPIHLPRIVMLCSVFLRNIIRDISTKFYRFLEELVNLSISIQHFLL